MKPPYNIKDSFKIEELSISICLKYMNSHPLSKKITDVTKEDEFQKLGIDFQWSVEGREKPINLDIKGDRYHRTGNYFLETISNMNKNTPGCFLYSESNYWFYCFVEIEEIHILDVKKIRKWFKPNMEKFIKNGRERTTYTMVGDRGSYPTVGILIPIREVIREVKGGLVKIVKLK